MTMKKTKLTALALAIAIQFVALQTAKAQFTIGIKAAANTTSYKNVTKNNLGVDAGVFMRFGQRFFFQPEVNYAFKSSTFKDVVNEFSTNIKLKQHYLSVPALLGYHFIDKDNFKFRLTIGPRFDFKIADNMEGTDWRTNNLQWGGQVGIGMDFWRFTLDLGYCFSADNFHNTANNTSQVKNMNTFLASLGFKFIK